MLPIWVFLFFAVLLLTVVYLLWRLKNCKCALYETFETAGAKEDTVDTNDDANETDKAVEIETKKEDTKVVEEEVDVESAPESKKKNSEKETGKEKETGAETEVKSKVSSDKSLNYGEMKLFDNLRENAYSLQDIKRMIREGEITEKMIEKFLARVETMENRSNSKRPEVSIEGFSGSRYASALFN